jgi:hypothetical protein
MEIHVLCILTMIILQRFLAILLWIPLFYFLDQGVSSSVSVYVNDNNVSSLAGAFIVTVLLDVLMIQLFLYGRNMYRKTFDLSDEVNE